MRRPFLEHVAGVFPTGGGDHRLPTHHCIRMPVTSRTTTHKQRQFPCLKHCLLGPFRIGYRTDPRVCIPLFRSRFGNSPATPPNSEQSCSPFFLTSFFLSFFRSVLLVCYPGSRTAPMMTRQIGHSWRKLLTWLPGSTRRWLGREQGAMNGGTDEKLWGRSFLKNGNYLIYCRQKWYPAFRARVQLQIQRVLRNANPTIANINCISGGWQCSRTLTEGDSAPALRGLYPLCVCFYEGDTS